MACAHSIDMHGVQGATKRLKVSRSVMDGSGKSQRVQVAACILACHAVNHEDAVRATPPAGQGLMSVLPTAAELPPLFDELLSEAPACSA